MKLIRITLTCLTGLALIGLVAVGSASAQPAMSRGEQRLSLSYDECMSRAVNAFTKEGWVNIGKGGAFVNAFKQNHGAYIMCNVAPENKIWVNIVVASLSQDNNVPGAERVQLQKWMDQPASGPPVSTRTCTFQYTYWDGSHWTARIERDQFVHAPNGDFGAAHSDTIIRYISWDGNRWTAKISRGQFVHAPNEDWSRAHNDVILNYVQWNGGQGTVRIGDCGVTGIP